MCQNDPPNKCAKMTCQNILPWKSAGFTHENNPPNLLARKICHFNSRLACQRSPLPCSKSPSKTRPANPPPPHSSANGAGGGAGSRPGPPTHIEQVLFLSFPISWMATYSCITQHIHIPHRVHTCAAQLFIYDVPLLLCSISFCALHTLVSYDILIFIERLPNCSWSGPRNIIMEIWRHRVSQTIPKCLWPQVWQLLFQKFWCVTGERGEGNGLSGKHLQELIELYTVCLTRFRIYKIALPPQTKTLEVSGPQTDKHMPPSPFTG